MNASAVSGLILLAGSLSAPRVLLTRPVAAPQRWSLPVAEGDHLTLVGALQRELLNGAPIELDASEGRLFELDGQPVHFRIARTQGGVSPWIDVPHLLDARMAGSKEAGHILRVESDRIVRWGITQARRRVAAHTPDFAPGLAA